MTDKDLDQKLSESTELLQEEVIAGMIEEVMEAEAMEEATEEVEVMEMTIEDEMTIRLFYFKKFV